MKNNECFVFSSECFPKSLHYHKLLQFPLTVNIKPFGQTTIPTNKKLLKCPKCGSYIFLRDSCSFCNNINFENNELYVYEWLEDEINLPKTLILIDGSKVSNSCGFFQEVIKNLKFVLQKNFKKYAVGVYSHNLMLLCSKGILVFPTFDDIEIPDEYFFNCIPKDFEALLNFKNDSLANHFEALNFARKIVGKNGKIIMMISSAIRNQKRISSDLSLNKIWTNNFTHDWEKLQESIKLSQIKVDILVNVPYGSLIDTIFFTKLIQPLNGNFMLIRESQIYNIQEILNDFLDNFSVNISFLSLDLFKIKNAEKINGILTKTLKNNSKQNNEILLYLKKEICMNSIPFQAIITYLNFEGKKVIRVFSRYISVTNDLLRISQSLNPIVLLRYIISELLLNFENKQMKISELKNQIISFLFPILNGYRNNVLHFNSNNNELLIPETLDYLPLHCLGILKSSIFCFGTELTERNYFIYQLNKSKLSDLSIICYPRLYYLNDYLLDESKQARIYQLKKSCLDSSGIYLMDDGFSSWIWVGELLSEDLCQKLFNCSEACFIEDIQQNENYESVKLFKLIKFNINLCVENRFGHNSFINHMVEDETIDIPSYHDFMKMLHSNLIYNN